MAFNPPPGWETMDEKNMFYPPSRWDKRGGGIEEMVMETF